MECLLRLVAVASSSLVRFFAYVFLQWIPGHHFPPLVLSFLGIYLTSIWALSGQSTLDESRAKQKGRNDKGRDAKAGKAGDRNGDTRGDSGAASLTAGCVGSVVTTLLTGLPSRRSKTATLLTIGVNVVLSILTLDFLLRGVILYPKSDLAFSRVGYVSPTTAKILIREPDQSQLPLYVYYQEAEHGAEKPDNPWVQAEEIFALANSTDYTVPVTLDNLKPSTQYRYSISNNQKGVFSTASWPGSRNSERLSFVTSSCIKPNFPYNPLSHPLRLPGVELLTSAIAKLPSVNRPAFMLFLGDFIYIDVPFRFGSSASHYRSEYRRVYSSPTWQKGPERPIDLPWIHTLDDHEIGNDWHEGNVTEPYPAAAEPYSHYHLSVNPPIPATPFANPANTTYSSFIHGPASFFILDTRTYRSNPSQPDSTMLGTSQLNSLLDYLSRPEPAGVKWKIVASSVPFTKNWHIGTEDTWGGFLNERRKVFEAMWHAEQNLGVRIILLSGDRHEFGATRFPEPKKLTSTPGEDGHEDHAEGSGVGGPGVHEFSVGPLSMFYLPVRTYRQYDDEDVAIKYVPDGNSKFGLIDIDVDDGGSSAPASSVLTYSLYVDGEVVWKYQLSVPLEAPMTEDRSLPDGVVLHDIVPVGLGIADALGKFEVLVKGVLKKGKSMAWETLGGIMKGERAD
ncbi:hypothetical protein FQN54_005329 [Arachnomyces sp. PD_36]|nr:hypothetical protein FQN54_005329 [Arachnomyces sp. PD_36]